ncbi:MAG: permease-like cell division protein FtsX [Thermoleophilia bacterium]
MIDMKFHSWALTVSLAAALALTFFPAGCGSDAASGGTVGSTGTESSDSVASTTPASDSSTGSTGASPAQPTEAAIAAATGGAPDGTYVYAYDQMEVFIKPNASEAQIQEVGAAIRAMPEVRNIYLVSKDEALQKIRWGLSGHEDVLNSLEGNPLPPSYLVSVAEPGQAKTVGDRLAKNPAVDNSPGTQDGINYYKSGIRLRKIIIKGKTYQLFDDRGDMFESGVYSIRGDLILFDPAGRNATGFEHGAGEIRDGAISLLFVELHAVSI